MADPIWLEKELKKAGLKVEVLDGAYERGHGDMISPLWGVMDHHTGASGNSSPWSIAQHPDLGLCSQIFLRRDGTVVICGLGIAWHGGLGSYPGIRDVNAELIGVEADNNGTEGWKSAQYWAYVKLNAVILNHEKRGKERSIGHKEWAGKAQGKWDPGGMDMVKFRDDIGREQQALIKGATQVVVPENQINRWAGYAKSWIGARAFPEERDLRGKVKGKYVTFANGTIYWRADTNSTFIVPNSILEVWKRFDYENGIAGMPQAQHVVVEVAGEDGKRVPIGDVQGFTGSTILRRYGTEGFLVHGQIGERYAKEGYQKGHLGWPLSDEYVVDGIIVQDFENGKLLCDKNGTVKVDKGSTIFVPPGR